MPTLRKLAKRIAREKNGSDKELIEVCSKLFASPACHEQATLALLLLESVNTQPSDWQKLKTWAAHVDNWAHSDGLSSHYNTLFRMNEALLYPTFKTWNTHKNPWLRRLSLTSLIYYAGSRPAPTDYERIIALVEPRLLDSDIYVQKAVGWTLRECAALYPKKTNAFIEKHAEALSAVAFSSATERWSKQQKAPLKERRRLARKASSKA